MTKKNKNKLKKIDVIDSIDKAVYYVEKELHGFEDDPELFTESKLTQVRLLIAKIWADAYSCGRKDTQEEASIEAAEAEWFNG